MKICKTELVRREVFLFLVGVADRMSLLDRLVCSLSCGGILVADGLNGLAVKMEFSFRLFLQLAFGNPTVVLEKMFLCQSKTEDIHSKHGRIPDCRRTIGLNPLSMPGRTLFGHEA
jgi:hypothetical protein